MSDRDLEQGCVLSRTTAGQFLSMKKSASTDSFELDLDSVFNIVLIGDPSVRTTICNSLSINTNIIGTNDNSDTDTQNKRESSGTEPWTTEGTIVMNEKNVRIRFYDSVVPRTDGVVFLNDASNNESFRKHLGQLSKFQNFAASSITANTAIPIVMLSIYSEAPFLPRELREGEPEVQVSSDEAKKFAQINSITYFEEILDAFQYLITEISLISAESTHPRHIPEKSAMFRLAEIDFNFSIIMLGDSEVGKTNLIARFVEGKFNFESDSLIGVDFKNRAINIDNKKIVTCIFDTNTSERFRPTLSLYYHLMVGAVLVYDITKYSTFQNIQSYLDEFREKADKDAVIILVGNKNDLQMCRAVTTQEGEEFAKENQLLFTETSGLDRTNNVDKMFRSLLTDIYYKIRSSEALKGPGAAIFSNCQIRPKRPQTKKDKCTVM